MPAPYSADLRERVVDAYKSGKGSARMLAKMFGVGKTTVTDYLRLEQLNGNVNVKFHSNVKAVKAIEATGATILFLPPYSPELSPIENMWSKLKQIIYRAPKSGGISS